MTVMFVPGCELRGQGGPKILAQADLALANAT
jgi:hypothetical protein